MSELQVIDEEHALPTVESAKELEVLYGSLVHAWFEATRIQAQRRRMHRSSASESSAGTTSTAALFPAPNSVFAPSPSPFPLTPKLDLQTPFLNPSSIAPSFLLPPVSYDGAQVGMMTLSDAISIATLLFGRLSGYWC